MASPGPSTRMRDLYAARAAPWIRQADDRILVAWEKRRHPILDRLARWARSPDAVTVSLEAEGARAWELADGSRRLADIATELADPTADSSDDGALALEAARVEAFTRALATRGLLRLTPEAAPTTHPDPGFPPGFREVSCPRCARATWLSGGRGLRYVCPGCRRVVREQKVQQKRSPW